MLFFEQTFMEFVPICMMAAKDQRMTLDIEAAARRFAEFVRHGRHLQRPGEPSVLPNEKISELTDVPTLLVEVWMRTLQAGANRPQSLRRSP